MREDRTFRPAHLFVDLEILFICVQRRFGVGVDSVEGSRCLAQRRIQGLASWRNGNRLLKKTFLSFGNEMDSMPTQ